MLNFAVEPSLLAPFVPRGTELDTWNDQAFVSLVGFLFSNTRLLGLPIPWHRTFEEVNLRFYVRREAAGHVRRAVTFIREIVPRAAIATVARLAYNEPYVTRPMRHQFGALTPHGIPRNVEYRWKLASGWATLRGTPTGDGTIAAAGSQEAFITEHYWGFTRQRDASTIEYHVAHPAWRVWALNSAKITGDHTAIYGRRLAELLHGRPTSAFLADGSEVNVYAPTRIHE